MKALEAPQIAKDPVTGIQVQNLMPNDSAFVSVVYQSLGNQKPLNMSKLIEASYRGQKVFINWNYDECCVELVQPTSEWEHKTLLIIRSIQEWKSIASELKYNPDDDQVEGLEWFFMDMDKEARSGNRKAIGWKWD